MNPNYLINVISSLHQVGSNIASNVQNKISNLFQEHFIKGHYVTREEHDILKEQVHKLLNKTNNK